MIAAMKTAGDGDAVAPVDPATDRKHRQHRRSRLFLSLAFALAHLAERPGGNVVVDEPDWVPAESLATELEHVRKWPAEHWKLAFQGQIRAVSDADRDALLDRLRVAAGAAA